MKKYQCWKLTFQSYNHMSYVTPNNQMFEFKDFFLLRQYIC